MTVAAAVAVVDSTEVIASGDLDPVVALTRRRRDSTEDSVAVPAASDSFGGDGSVVRSGCCDGGGRDADGCGVEMMKSVSDGGGDGEVKPANGAGGGGGGTELIMKFTYRASAPAHRRVKESPLSSASIFKQTMLQAACWCTLPKPTVIGVV